MADGTIGFTEFLIQDKYRYVYGVSAADFNRDGKIDLVTADIREEPGGARKSNLYWFENDGTGQFTRHSIFEGEPGWLERNAAGDISGNGFPDVVIVNNLLGHILWFENDGKPGAGHWKRHVVTTNAPRAYNVALADFDGDGALDVALASYKGNLVAWFKNPGKSGWDNEWPRFVIDDHMTEARTIAAVHFNGDGRMDLLATSIGAADIPVGADPAEHQGSIVWYENPGDPVSKPWIKHVIDDQSRAPCHGQAVDIDGDGDLDVVMAFGMRAELSPQEMHEIAWYENLGGAKKWRRHTIGALPFAYEAIAADLDADGRMEVIATDNRDKVVWFKHDGDPSGAWTMRILKENWPSANQPIVADLNGDNRLDIIAASDDGAKRFRGANELRWWRNDGVGKNSK